MAVKISAGAFNSSNKPQPLPKPKPPFEIFPTLLTMSDGRKVRVSVPLPDQISMVVDITKAIFGPKFKPGIEVAEWMFHTGKYLAGAPKHTQILGQQFFPKQQWYKHVTLAMGARDSFVRFEFSKANTKGPAKLRLDLNPRKLGPEGFKKLLAILCDPKGPFDGKALLQRMHVTSIDIAVDCEGIHSSEVIVRHGSESQRCIYVGTDGEFETVNLHAKATKTKGLGRLLVSIYDRVKERQKRGKKPPFGPSPLTRIEMPKRLNAPKNSLSDVAALPDPYGSLKAGYLMDQGNLPADWWRQYVALRRTLSHARAASMLGLTKTTALQFEAAYSVPIPNLVKKGLNWSGCRSARCGSSRARF